MLDLELCPISPLHLPCISPQVLDLELCPHVWKRLAGVQLDEADLVTFDEAHANSIRWMRSCDVTDGIDEDAFGEIIFDNFEATLSDGSVRELIEEGSATPVTFGTRHAFARLAVMARLHEGAAQCDAILAGLHAVVPCARLLQLMSGRELQLLVCGEADVDLGTRRTNPNPNPNPNPHPNPHPHPHPHPNPNPNPNPNPDPNPSPSPEQARESRSRSSRRWA